MIPIFLEDKTAGYKVKMCKSKIKIKPCHCQALKKVPMGRVMLYRQ